MSKRDADLKMLDKLLEHEELKSDERQAFEDMRARLSEGQHQLTAKQSEWVKKRLEDFQPAYENLVSSGKVSKVVKHRHHPAAECTSACPGWVPPSLQNLPKRPPTRRPLDR